MAGEQEATATAVDTAQQSGAQIDTAVTQLISEGDVSGLTEFLASNVVPTIIPAAIGLGVVFIGYLAAKYLSRVISKPICRRVDETLGRFIGKAIFYAIMLAVVAAVATQFGMKLGGIAALLAGASFAVGLAFQGTLSNFAAGVLMMVFRPFKVGDVINAGGVTGKVNEIDLFTTTLDTPDNRRIIVPNSAISGGTIENVSYHPHRRIEVVVGVDYNADIEATRGALQRAADVFSGQMISGENRGAAIVLGNLGDSAVEWKVRMWVASADYWSMLESLTAEVKRQLDAVGIGIPFPQLDVHLNRIDGAEEPAQSRPRIRPAARPARRDTIRRDPGVGPGVQSMPYAS